MENNNIINKLLNYIILALICVIFVMAIYKLFEPLTYNSKSKVDASRFDQSPYVYSALDKYIYAIRRENKKYINKVIPLVRRKSKKVYNEYAKYLDENFSKINITSIELVGEEKMLVKYTINSKEENVLVMKIYENTDYFKVYFDEKLENI